MNQQLKSSNNPKKTASQMSPLNKKKRKAPMPIPLSQFILFFFLFNVKQESEVSEMDLISR